MVREILDFLNELVAHAPPMFWPLFLGWGISAALAQRLKFYLPLTWDSRLRALLTQGIAFWSGLGVVVLCWPDRYGFLAGVFVGLWSPAAYAVAVRTLVPAGVREYLSADVRE